MFDNSETEEINKVWKQINIIWITLIAMLFLYLLMGLLISKKIQITTDKDFIFNLRIALFILSFITIIAINYIRRAIVLSKIKIKRRVEDIKNPYLVKYLIAMTVALALAESIGIYGVALYSVGKNIIDLFLLIFIALFAMFYYRPKKEDIINIAKKREIKSP